VIPAVSGMNKDDAIRLLNENGFANVDPVSDPNEPVTSKANDVTRIDPAEGASVTLDTQITLYYASGFGQVPNFKGLTQNEAIQVGKNNGFTNLSFNEEESTQPVGAVFEQTPGAGSNVKRTTKIHLKIAKAPPTAPPTPTSPTPSGTPTVP